MTFSRHAFVLKLGIAVSALTFLMIVMSSARILPYYPELVSGAAIRVGIRPIAEFFGDAAPYSAYVTMIFSIFYSLVTLILLFYFFEKTQSVEAHFFMFFVFSFTSEILRSALPLRLAMGLPGVYLGLVSHILVFCRYFGVFSLFCASLYAAGFKSEKEENIIFPLVVITLFVAFKLPINNFTWNTSLCLVNAYPIAFKALETSTSVLTVFSFINGAVKRGQKEYYYIGLGAALSLLGRSLIFGNDNYILPAVGAVILVAGTYLICVYIRRIYLWV